MSSPSIKLNRLRGWFVIYYVLKSLVGVVVALFVLKSVHVNCLDRFGWGGFSPGSLVFFSLMTAALIMIIALLIFSQLLKSKNWARMLLLVIAWLTVGSAVFSLLASVQISTVSAWLAHWLPNLDWKKLMQYDRFEKVLEILFWGYVIAVLQFDAEVKKEFVPSPPTNDSGKDIGG